ncbi:hypothetical protein HOC13_00810 [Candidatus Woesearchaeota archaeon]|jgi:hypothetical protein|nr:hypothetical protein [Candidatus Woesearchaeota archaeon]
MELTYKTKNNRLKVNIESDSVKDSFKKLAEFQEVFDESACGMCNNDDLQFIVRTVDNNDYYELRCKKCGAKLAYGQHKTGGSLFPKRKLENGSFDKEHRGWHKWTPQG